MCVSFTRTRNHASLSLQAEDGHGRSGSERGGREERGDGGKGSAVGMRSLVGPSIQSGAWRIVVLSYSQIRKPSRCSAPRP